MKRLMLTTVVAAACLPIAGGASPTVDHRPSPCDNSTLKGIYGFALIGTRPSGPGGPLEQVIGVGVRRYNGDGTFTQVDNIHGSINGSVTDRPGSGTYELNHDCSGVTYLQNEGCRS